MKIRSFQFRGTCFACNEEQMPSRASISVAIEPDGYDAWICVSCARKLRRRLAVAIRRAAVHDAAGHVYRYGKWRTRDGKPIREAAP